MDSLREEIDALSQSLVHSDEMVEELKNSLASSAQQNKILENDVRLITLSNSEKEEVFRT